MLFPFYGLTNEQVTKCLKFIEDSKKEQLLHFFESDILNLQRLLNQDLSKWLKTGEIDGQATK